jgi:sulfite reductase (ferredoxin)
VLLGDFYTDKALAELIKNHGANELRFSLKQNIVLKYKRRKFTFFFYQELAKLDFVTLVMILLMT